MNTFLSMIRTLSQIALGNLFASRAKTLIVGGIISFGAFLTVVVGSLLDSVSLAMSRSITGSIAGDIQVYSSESKEVLDVFGGLGPGGNDVAPIADFAQLRNLLISVPNVKSVVPMGVGTATVSAGNPIEQILAKLRETASKWELGEKREVNRSEYAPQMEHVRQIIRVLRADYENARKLRADSPDEEADLETIHKVDSDEFWSAFHSDPLASLELLENRIAPLANDSDMLFLRYLGSDPQLFQRVFDRMVVEQGENIPVGRRGFLFSRYFYEDQIKLKIARILDRIKSERDLHHRRIADAPELQRLVAENTSLIQEILLQLDATTSELFRAKLQRQLKSQQISVGKLLTEFLSTDDANFDERYRFFYVELAPHLQLYKVRVGDTLTVKAYTRGGYVRTANLRVYGVYAFRGLERSPQAGAMNIMDLVSFRDLYGYQTAEGEQEIRELRQQAGVNDVSSENAERVLFETAAPRSSSTDAHDAASKASASVAEAIAQISGSRASHSPEEKGYDPAQLQQGTVLNAAVVLNDSRNLSATLRAIEAKARTARLSIKVLPWYSAVGVTGQFTELMRVVLFSAIGAIFLVAVIVVNNALVMAAVKRVREFGTMRAIGAQRGFVWWMVLFESIVTGLLFGAIGTLLGGSLIAVMSRRGIPAWNDVVTFFFSGPRLFLALSAKHLLVPMLVVLIVSVISSAYPAWIAMRISPRQAMDSEE